LRRIIRLPKTISNTQLWEATGEKRVILQIRMRKLRWISHTLKRDESIEKQALDSNTQEARRRGRPKKTCERNVLEEAGKCGETWSEVKSLAGNRVGWTCLKNALCSYWNERIYYY
jgi:hypothetical protein